MRSARSVLATIILFCFITATSLHAVSSLPDRLADAAFWRLIGNLSEPSGVFASQNFLSNEAGFQAVIPSLQKTIRPGGVYVGVGPEQNFTYIAALRPKTAFIIDIRRGNMLEHLVYKALFEMSANRADFLSHLFSRKRPTTLNDATPIDDVMYAYRFAPEDDAAFHTNLLEIQTVLTKKHAFQLSIEDLRQIENIYSAFRRFGPNINYGIQSAQTSPIPRTGRLEMPNYVELMTAKDRTGAERSYLANEESYAYVRALEINNLIIPVTGDFGGPKAIRALGRYLKDHAATVSVFYCSNVEEYLFGGFGNGENGGWKNFYANVAALPLDDSSTFIRSIGAYMSVPVESGGGRTGPDRFQTTFPDLRAPNLTASIKATLAAVKAGRIHTFGDILAMSH